MLLLEHNDFKRYLKLIFFHRKSKLTNTQNSANGKMSFTQIDSRNSDYQIYETIKQNIIYHSINDGPDLPGNHPSGKIVV